MRTTRFPLALALALAAAAFTPTPTFAQQPGPPPPTPAASIEICTGGTDEDGDGTIDCADTDCTADPACVTPAPPAVVVVPPAPPGPPATTTVTGTGTATVSSGTVTTTVTSTDPAAAKKALAERWGAVYDPTTGNITCTTPDGKVCWSPGYEAGKAWDWNVAPMRWAKSWGAAGEYVSKGTFLTIDRANAIVGLGKRLDESERTIREELAGKADKTELDAALEQLAEARAALDAAAANFSAALEPVQAQVNDATSQVALLTGRVDTAEADIVAIKADVAELKGDMRDVKAEVLEMPRPGIALEAGLQASAGNPVTNGEEGDDLAFRRIPYGLGLSVAATLSVCSSKASCFLLQGGVVLSPRDAGGTGFGAFGNVGGEFRIGLGLSVGPLVGYQWRGHGLRNGGSSAQSSEAAFGLFLRAALPIEIAPAVPGVTFSLQGLAGTSRHDPDSHGRFEPEASYGVLVRAAFSIGTPLRRTRIAD